MWLLLANRNKGDCMFKGKTVIFALLLVMAALAAAPDEAAASVCGDSVCSPDEASWCSDCGCGDGFCSSDEVDWCSDCTSPPFCGDSFCDPWEIGNCVSDCGPCDVKYFDSYQCSGKD